MRLPSSLARQNTWLLAVAFILIELLVAAALFVFLMLPVARQATDDLAGLMILAAQTWAELPPETRPDFAEELRRSHQLALRTAPVSAGNDEWHPPYFYLLEAALAQRLGTRQHLTSARSGADVWYWVNLPAGDGSLAVGLPRERISTQPLLALLLALGGGLAAAVGIAYWLARRITAPLAQLAAATTRIGQGDYAALLPETGPRELAMLAQRFNTMARQVRDLLSARTTLFAGVSHDLRTPLARMRLALEMLKDAPSPALIARLESDIDEMNRLIATLLDLARGLEREPPGTLDLAAFLAELGQDFSSPGCTVAVTCPACRRLVPSLALRRAVGNLLQNALRHAPESTESAVELVCTLDATHCRIGVLDNGPGIPPERIESMFQPFQRLDASRSPATGGAGLGLAIVRELARVNGWQVRLENRATGGLAAWIELPAMPA